LIAAIGAFDGFHKGHQALLRVAEKRADESGAGWGIITFEHNPEVLPNGLFVSPKSKYLFTIRERLMLEKFFHIPASIRLAFTHELSQMTPEQFLDYISEKAGVLGVVVGEGFRFGRERSGTVDLLARESGGRRWMFDAIPLLRDSRGYVISSTAIREAVAGGDMARAWEMQGYPFFCVSRVVHGNGRGNALGYPTANLGVASEKVSLRYGVYATLVYAMGKWYIGAANAGLNPTFDDVDEMRFEVNLLDFSGDLYDREIAVFIIEYVRDEVRFDAPGSLKEQIHGDGRVIRDIGERAMEKYPELWESLEGICAR
jgi:riboflavin kinase/FMN adenylyltransferase